MKIYVQKCLISKMKGMMELVAKAGKQKGIWKSDTYYLGSVKRCNVWFEHVELLFHYPGVTHIRLHEECSYLTIMDLYNKKYVKQFADKILWGENPWVWVSGQPKWLWVNSCAKMVRERAVGAYTPPKIMHVFLEVDHYVNFWLF